MEVFGDEQQLCPCYKERQEFQKLVKLKDSGLVVYCHRPRTEDIRHAEAVENAVNTSRDVIILYNKKNLKITSSELTSELEKENISCSRCRKTFGYAQELVQEIKSIDKKMVIGICDHCRKKAQGSKKPFCACDKIVKKFISVRGEQKEDTQKYFKTLPLKMGHLRRDTMVNKENQNAYSNFQNSRGLSSPASRHEPKVQQMFSHSNFKSDDTELSGTNLKEGYVKRAVAFIEPIEPVKTSSAHTPHESENINTIIPSTLLIDSETTFVETSVGLKELPRPSLTDRKQEEIFEDIPTMDAKEALKRRHDLSLRQMMRLEKDSVVPYSVSKRPDIYETPKITPWAQKEPTSKYRVESEIDIKIPTLKHKRSIRDLDYVSNREIKFRSTRASQDSYIEPRKPDKYHHDNIKRGLYDSEEVPKKVKKLEERYIADEELKLQRSVDKISQKAKKLEQHVEKSKSEPIETVGKVLKHQYTFFFPNVMEKDETKVKLDVSSSQLTKQLQEKFRLQAEREKKRQEEERQTNLEQAQKKKLSQEKKRLQAEEKKRQAIEDQKKIEEEQKKIAEHKNYSQNDLESKPVVKKLKQDKPRRDKFKEKDGEIISESKVNGKISKVSMVPKKHVMPKPDHRIKTDGVSEKNVMDVKVKPKNKSNDEVTEKGSKDLKSGIEPKDKRNEVSKISKTDLKAKFVREDKDVAGKQKIKPKKDDEDKKLQREETDTENFKKQLEHLRKEKEAQKAQTAKKREDIDAPSKKGKTSKMTRDASDEIKVSVTKIQESLKKEKAKFEQEDKGVVKEQKVKSKKEDLDEKLQREEMDSENFEKLLEQLQKEKKALKAQTAKKREEIDAPSKKGKASKKTRDASDEIKVSVTKIQESLKKEKAKFEQEDKGVVKEQKVKPKKEDLDEKLQREETNSKNFEKQLEQLQKEKEALKAQAAKIEQEDKGMAKEQKVKLAREYPDEKLLREKIDKENLKKQLEHLRKEKEARKAPTPKKREEIDAPSKKGKASKKTRDTSDEIKVSISKIQKSLKIEKSGKQETFEIKQGKGKELKNKTLNKESSIALRETSELKKLQAEHLKKKEKILKKKNQLEYEAKVAKAKEEADLKAKRVNLKWTHIKMIKRECSDEKLKMVIIKQAMKMDPCDIHPEVLTIHKCNHQHSGKQSSFCHLCVNPEFELDVLSLDNKKNLTTDKTDIIIGEKIVKYKQRLEKIKEPDGVPILFHKEFCVESDQQLKQIEQIIPQETKSEEILVTKMEMEPGEGVIRYALSDRTFIDKGWTMLPTEKVVRKMNVYRMRPAHPEFDWFEHNKNKRLMTYDTGERLAEFDDNGRGRWYYRSGRLALDYYDAEESNAQQRFVIYSSGEPDERGRTHPITILATFDYLGNGIVFDHAGKIRLKYNQTEGVVLDRGIGPVSHWKWHSLNDPPVLQQVMIDTQMAHKDPNIIKLGSVTDMTTRPDNEEMLTIEYENFIKEKSKNISQKFKPFQIKMKALKINEHFSLKVLDQATVYLIFRDGSTNLKLNIGMILDHREIVDTDTVEVGEVSNILERFPARTDSLAGLQRSVAHARRYERQHAERERWLRRPEPFASADHLTAAASPPMRLPLRTVPTRSSYSTEYSSKKPTNNLYYDTRLRC